MKKILSALLAVVIVTMTMSSVFALRTPDVTVTLDGNVVEFPDAQPFIDNKDRTLVPIRFVSEAMGAIVSWDGETETVTIQKGKDTIITQINSAKATLNGIVSTFDTSTRLRQERTFVPLRFIAELLNCDVQWEAETEKVVITSPPAPVAFPEPEISLHFSEYDGDNRLMWITLDNLRDYSDCNNYQFKIDFVSPAELNTVEIYEGEALGWQTTQLNQWQQILYADSPLFTVNRKYYTTRENAEQFVLENGMELKFVLSVKRMCSGEVKEYEFSKIYQNER